MRYCGLLTLVEAFNAPQKCVGWEGVSQATVLTLFLEHRTRVDNWDLIDASVGTILGGSLLSEEYVASLSAFVADVDSDSSLGDIAKAVTTHLPSFYTSLINSHDFWEIRMSVVCLQKLIKNGHLDVSLLLLQHQLYRRLENGYHMTIHGTEFKDLDLVNKALGWMLRESGRVNREKLVRYLDQHVHVCSKTTVRYATEHFEKAVSARYVSMCGE
ncbi:UNVERIFIED_CONTAM: hypothetical protein HDU68_011425 [Siphonaria sp. JEL0065]|nr:hypothetical protein HDU68_011425 [Siphonaria sp. JEL0065]